ncbi:hypothetical protein TWF696_007997 [Orbilia brochopaga]|uniref:Uncharacterized protein n=1 Tax=Orbilia brochopaga TaxID=3140254 RepID=A0AAV9URB0_9PEZI
MNAGIQALANVTTYNSSLPSIPGLPISTVQYSTRFRYSFPDFPHCKIKYITMSDRRHMLQNTDHVLPPMRLGQDTDTEMTAVETLPRIPSMSMDLDPSNARYMAGNSAFASIPIRMPPGWSEPRTMAMGGGFPHVEPSHLSGPSHPSIPVDMFNAYRPPPPRIPMHLAQTMSLDNFLPRPSPPADPPGVRPPRFFAWAECLPASARKRTDYRYRSKFMALPREIRDEIYRYLLVPIDAASMDEAEDDTEILSPLRDAIYRPRVHRVFPEYQPVRADLAIFRVCKQVHDEAAKVFYGQRTFVIRVATMMKEYNVTDHLEDLQGAFKVFYTAPWERLQYTCDYHVPSEATDEPPVGRPKLVAEKRDLNCWSQKSYLSDAKYVGPAPRYRHLLRRVRVELEDYRHVEFLNPDDANEENATMQAPRYAQVSNRMLVPVATRLQTLLSASGSDLKIDVVAKSAFFGREIVLRDGSRVRLDDNGEMSLHRFGRRLPMSTSLKSEVEQILQNFCKEVLCTVWPLTGGPWKFSVTSEDVFAAFLAGKRDELFHELERETRLEDERYWQLGLGVEDAWIVKNGRLLVMDKTTLEQNARLLPNYYWA